MLSTKNLTWVVVTDSNDCRIYRYDKEPVQLVLLKEISHPENKLRDFDITSDKPGRYHTGNQGHGTYSQSSDPKEIKIDNFANEIAKELDHARTINAYQRLIIIALPHMRGLLMQHINKHVSELITHTIEKDLLHMTPLELLGYIQHKI